MDIHKKWKKVDGAVRWQPSVPGEELIGRYLGYKERRYAPDEEPARVIVVRRADDQKLVILASCVVAGHIEMGVIEPGTVVKIVYRGSRQGGRGEWRDFETFVEDDT